MELQGQEYIEKFFAENGNLEDLLEGYEFSEAQLSMLRFITDT